jgi:hypothetical protein
MLEAERKSILVAEKKIPVAALKEAISLRCAMCYTVMSIANQIGGSRTDAWLLCHSHSLKELLEEADALGLDLDDVKASIDDIPVKDTLLYRNARGLVSKDEWNAFVRRWKNGEPVKDIVYG